jgi:proteasome lid subunit RPN8/RPN11
MKSGGSASTKAPAGGGGGGAPAGPDVSEMEGRELPKSSFPGRGRQAFRVFLDAAVHEQIRKHAAEDTSVEICGVLVGTWRKDDDGPYVSITAAIAGEAVSNKLSEVTFTHETWAKIHKRMDAEFADRSIVGWYHTHPNFGIFLSDRDCFIHEHFFREPGQVAYVVDPIRKQEGFFIWSGGKPTPASHYWVGSNVRVAPPPAEMTHEPRGRGSGASESASGASAGRRAEPMPPQPPLGNYAWVTSVLMGLCLFMFGYAASSWMTGMRREAELTRFAVLKSIKPGLGPSLANLNWMLGNTALRAAKMAEVSGATTQPVDQKAAWADIASQLAQYQKDVEGLHGIYALSPQEEDALSQALNQRFVPVATRPTQGAPAAPATQKSTAPAGGGSK